MKILTTIARVLLGAGFTIFGLNFFLPILPPPPPLEGTVAQFMAVMGPTHWLALIGFFQLLGGLLVLAGGTAPLGLLILAPILVNILSFHLFLEGGHGIMPGLVFAFFEIYLFYAYRDYFLPLWTNKARPRSIGGP